MTNMKISIFFFENIPLIFKLFNRKSANNEKAEKKMIKIIRNYERKKGCDVTGSVTSAW